MHDPRPPAEHPPRHDGRHDARVWIDFAADPGAAQPTMRYGARMSLRIPAVLAFTVIGGAAGAAGALAISCGGTGAPLPDAMLCSVQCIPSGVGSNGCTPPTCATGPNHDVCPMGCTPDPIA